MTKKDTKSKIIDFSELNKIKKYYTKKKTVLVGGCFDVLHFGHAEFLKRAKAQGDFLIVALESDEFIEKKKKRKPIHNQQQRSELLASLEFVDLVMKIPFLKNDRDYFRLTKTIGPSIVAVTKNDPKFKNKKEQIEQIGGQIKVVCPKIKGFSTKSIIKYATISGN